MVNTLPNEAAVMRKGRQLCYLAATIIIGSLSWNFPKSKDPAPTREQMIETYLNTLATVLGSMEEAKKNMYAFSTTTYTGFQCTVSEETSKKFKGLPGVLWVLLDSHIDVKTKDFGGDKYINGVIIPCQYLTYPPKQARSSKYKSKAYVIQRDGPLLTKK